MPQVASLRRGWGWCPRAAVRRRVKAGLRPGGLAGEPRQRACTPPEGGACGAAVAHSAAQRRAGGWAGAGAGAGDAALVGPCTGRRGASGPAWPTSAALRLLFAVAPGQMPWRACVRAAPAGWGARKSVCGYCGDGDGRGRSGGGLLRSPRRRAGHGSQPPSGWPMPPSMPPRPHQQRQPEPRSRRPPSWPSAWPRRRLAELQLPRRVRCAPWRGRA